MTTTTKKPETPKRDTTKTEPKTDPKAKSTETEPVENPVNREIEKGDRSTATHPDRNVHNDSTPTGKLPG